MLQFMSGSQVASLFIGIIFSILAVGDLILVAKYAKQIGSFGKSLALALICPLIAYTSWLFLILSYIKDFKNNEFMNIIVSILVAIFTLMMVIIVARTLYAKHYADEDQKDETEVVLAEENNN